MHIVRGGVATANAADVTNKDNPITSSNVRVSDVGAQTANVSFDYKIDPAQVDEIKDVCFSIEVQRITDITPIEKAHSSANTIGGTGFPYIMDCSTGVSDDELTAGSYDSIYGFHGDKEYKGVFNDNDLSTDGSKVAFKASGQWFARYFNKNSWNGKASGSFDFPLIGLTPNTAYTNNAKGSDFPSYPYQEVVQDTSNELLRNGVHVKTPVDIRQVALYAQPIYKDSNTKVSHWVEDNENALKFVPDFTTKSVAAVKPTETLPDKTDVKAAVAGGKVEPGKTARVYIDNLKDVAKGKADANSLFWYAYIYSTPQALTGPGGVPFVTVKKEEKTGKYYFDALIPSNLPDGEHKISVQDENGTAQAWTPVTVGDTSPTPTPVDKSKLNAAVGDAAKLAEKDYTKDSWAPFAKALADVKTVAGKQDASQADVDAAVKALADAQSGLKKAETVPSKPSKPDNGDNDKPSDSNKPAATRPSASDKKADSKNDGKKQGLAKTGVDVRSWPVRWSPWPCWVPVLQR